MMVARLSKVMEAEAVEKGEAGAEESNGVEGKRRLVLFSFVIFIPKHDHRRKHHFTL